MILGLICFLFNDYIEGSLGLMLLGEPRSGFVMNWDFVFHWWWVGLVSGGGSGSVGLVWCWYDDDDDDDELMMV